MITPNPIFKNFLNFFKDSPGRLTKYVELLTLKEESNVYATTDRKSLREVGIVINTKCNLKCVWCHREEKHIKSYNDLKSKMEEMTKKIASDENQDPNCSVYPTVEDLNTISEENEQEQQEFTTFGSGSRNDFGKGDNLNKIEFKMMTINEN